MSLELAKAAIDALQTSKPIIRISKMSTDYSDVPSARGEVIHKARNSVDTSNLYSHMAVQYFSERYNSERRCYEVQAQDILIRIKEVVYRQMRDFMFRHAEQKNFSETKMGKWYDKFALQNDIHRATLFNLYSYLLTNGAFNKTADTENKHVKNGMSLLEYVFNNNFKEEQIKGKKREEGDDSAKDYKSRHPKV